MESLRIAELLQPFLAAPLGETQLSYISTYIDLLLRWNARVNLTSVRRPEDMVTRHFGESLFAARRLFPSPTPAALIDVGTGAGFPGVPLKLWNPELRLTLIESNNKKVAFLRQLKRSLTLTDIDVFAGRAEDYSGPLADNVTLRAVEDFAAAAQCAARLVAPGGRLALLIGQAQMAQAAELLPSLDWGDAMSLPLASTRILIIGRKRT